MDDRLTPEVVRINNMKKERQHLRGTFAQTAQQAGVDVNALAQMNRRNEAIGHAVGSLGLLAEVLAEEIVVLRANVRQRIRLFSRFLGDQLSGVWGRLLRVFASAHSYKPIRLEGSAALGVAASEYQGSKDVVVASYSLIDLAKILLTDDVEDGIARQFQLWSKPWTCLPERKIIEDPEDQASEFQFFNRPLTFDDEDEILSLPSTQQTGTLRMQSIEAKMAKLSQQLSAILAAQAGTRSRVSSDANSQQKSPSAISIDDGVCMQSRSSRSRNESPVPSLPSLRNKPLAKELPPVRPPPGPPPPPPPAPPLPLTPRMAKQAPQLDLENVQSVTPAKSMSSTSVESLPSPRVQLLQDIKQFKFNKTVAKSPGGTPLVKIPLRENHRNIDSGESVLAAIKYKFRNVRPSIDDEDETLTNNSFKDDEWTDDNGEAKSTTQIEQEGEMEVKSEHMYGTA